MAITVPVGYDTDGSSLDKQMTSDASRAGDKAGAAGGRSLGKSLLKGVAALGVARGIGSFLTGSLDEAREAQKVGALTANVIKTTGGAAKISAAQVGELSSAISAKVGIDDEAIQSGANLLLTFKNVRNEAGKGANIFDRATKAAVDLSASGFGDLTGTSKQLGKALNDPVKGISALGRSGVTFSEDQKKAIKAMVASNDLLGAQKIILKEVESQVKGAAEAQATSADKAKVAFGNLQEQVGGALLPVIDDLADVATDRLIPAVSELVSGFQDGTGAGGEIRDVLEDVGGVLSDVVGVGKDVLGFFNSLPGPVKESAVQLGVAYLAVTKLQGAMLGLRATGSGVSASLQKTFTREVPAALQTFDRYTANSVAQQGKLQGAASKTVFSLRGLGGAATAAGGAAGLLLLTKSATETNDSLGLLERTAGGALAGLAVAGPIGAAVGGGLGFLASAFTNSGDAAKAATPKFSDYASSLDDVTGASTRATRALILQDAQANGLTEKTRALGISDRLLVRGIANTGDARAKLVGVLREQNAAADAQFAKDKAALDQEKIGSALYSQKLSYLQEARDRTKDLAGAVLNQIGVVDQDRLKQLEANVALAEGKKATNDAKKALQDYKNTNGVATIGIKGDKQSRQAIRDVKTAAADVARTWTVVVDADNKAALAKIRAVINAANSVANSWVGTGSTPKASNPTTPPKSNGRADITVTPGDMTRTGATPVTIIQNNTGPTTARGQTDELQWALTYGTRARGAA